MLIAFLAVSMSVWAQGDVLWKKNFGGLGADEYLSVTAVSDGVIAVGCSRDWSFGNGDWEGVEGNGNYDAIIVKYDNAGNVVWKKNFGGSSFDYFYAVATVSDGVIAVGDSHRFGDGDWEGVTGKGNGDAIIVKFDFNGKVVWKKNFGGNGNDRYDGVTIVSDGIVAVGSSHYQSFGNGDWVGVAGQIDDDAIIVKYDHHGNVVWKKSFGTNYRDWYESVTAVSDGIIAVGHKYQSSSYRDVIIVKYDNNGNILWNKDLNNAGYHYYSVATVSDGVIAVGNNSSNDGIIVKYDNSGNVVWKKNLHGGFDCVTEVSDGVIVAGYAYISTSGGSDWEGFTGHGACDAILVKYDFNGNIVWKKHFGGKGYDKYHSIVAVPDGIIAVGESYDLLGSGSSFGNGDLEDLTGKGGGDAIIVKYSTNPTSITDNSQDATLRVYPNPTNGQLHITGFDGRDAMNGVCTDVQIFDVYGRKVLTAAAPVETHGRASLHHHHQPQHPTTTLDISHLPEGVYFLRIGGKTTKIVKINNN